MINVPGVSDLLKDIEIDLTDAKEIKYRNKMTSDESSIIEAKKRMVIWKESLIKYKRTSCRSKEKNSLR